MMMFPSGSSSVSSSPFLCDITNNLHLRGGSEGVLWLSEDLIRLLCKITASQRMACVTFVDRPCVQRAVIRVHLTLLSHVLRAKRPELGLAFSIIAQRRESVPVRDRTLYPHGAKCASQCLSGTSYPHGAKCASQYLSGTVLCKPLGVVEVTFSRSDLGLIEVTLLDLISAKQPLNFMCPVLVSRSRLWEVPSRTLSTLDARLCLLGNRAGCH